MPEAKNEEIRAAVRQYVAENYFRGDQARDLRDDTPLISTGFIDSIGVIGLVGFLESRFGIEFMPRDIDLHHLETMRQIEDVIKRKLEQNNPG
jgi:Phosphopantetheine attachment site.